MQARKFNSDYRSQYGWKNLMYEQFFGVSATTSEGVKKKGRLLWLTGTCEGNRGNSFVGKQQHPRRDSNAQPSAPRAEDKKSPNAKWEQGVMELDQSRGAWLFSSYCTLFRKLHPISLCIFLSCPFISSYASWTSWSWWFYCRVNKWKRKLFYHKDLEEREGISVFILCVLCGFARKSFVFSCLIPAPPASGLKPQAF